MNGVILDRFAYYRPPTVQDALALAGRHRDAIFLAGGQSLLPAMKTGRSRPAAIIDLGLLGGPGGALHYLRDGAEWLAIGAMTRHADIERSALLRRRAPLLARAVSTVGDPQVRHRGTVGGSLAQADPAADAAVALMALRADVLIDGPAGRRRVTIDDFFGAAALRSGELITEVLVVPSDDAPWGFAKFRRKSFEWAIVTAAFQAARPAPPCPRVPGAPGIASAGIALANMGPVTLRAASAERALAAGATPGEVAALADAESDPRADARASTAYRRHLSHVLLERALLQARSGNPWRWGSAAV